MISKTYSIITKSSNIPAIKAEVKISDNQLARRAPSRSDQTTAIESGVVNKKNTSNFEEIAVIILQDDVVNYTFKITSPDDEKVNFDGINRKYGLQKLYFSYHETKSVSPTQLRNMIPIIRVLLYRDFHLAVDSVIYEKRNDINMIDFIPYTLVAPSHTVDYDTAMSFNQDIADTLGLDMLREKPDNDKLLYPIYLDENSVINITTHIDIKKYIDYQLVMDPYIDMNINSLCVVWVALKVCNDYVQNSIVEINNLPFLLSTDNAENNEIIASVTAEMMRLLNIGVFSLCANARDKKEKNLINEIVTSFSFQRLESIPSKNRNDHNIYLRYVTDLPKRMNNDILFNSEKWFMDTLVKIIRKCVPTVIIIGKWIYDYHPNIENIIRLQYTALRSVAELTINSISPELINYMSNIHTYADLSVKCPIMNTNDMIKIRDRIGQLVDINMYIRNCESLGEAVVYRLYLSKFFADPVWLVVRLHHMYFIVGNITSDRVREVISEIDMESEKEYLRNWLINRYLEKGGRDLSELPLTSLLKVTIFDDQCYTWEEIEDDPMLKVAIMEKSHINDGCEWMGIYQNELSPSIVKYYPNFFNVKDHEMIRGEINIVKKDDKIVFKVNERKLYTISAGGDVDLDELKDHTWRLWRKGWFLTAWGSYWYRKYGEISIAGIRTIPSLLRNGDNVPNILKFLPICPDQT